MPAKDSPNQGDKKYWLFALKIVVDFGATIAVPVIFFVIIGQWFDKKYQASPWFTIFALIIAALVSGRIVYKKAKHYGRQYQELDKK